MSEEQQQTTPPVEQGENTEEAPQQQEETPQQQEETPQQQQETTQQQQEEEPQQQEETPQQEVDNVQQAEAPEETNAAAENGTAQQTSGDDVDPDCAFNVIQPEVLCEKQSVPVGGDETVRACPMLIDGHPISYMETETRTLHDVFLRGLKKSNNGPCLGWKPTPTTPYQWITYQQVLDRCQKFGSGMLAEGAEPNPGQFVGIFMQNRVEWKVTEQACNSYSMALVTLYDTLGPEAIKHIITQCELKYVVIDNNKKASTLLNGVKNGDFSFKLLVIVEELNEENKALAEETGTKVKTFSEIESLGGDNLKDFIPPKPEDLHTICYTSGTTGLPKGVMLTHANMVADHAGVFALGYKTFLDMSATDVFISYLPLAHIFERLMAIAIYFVGGSVGFYQGDVKKLLSDIAELQPTVFPIVPRLMNRIYDKIWNDVSQSTIRRFILTKAVKSKLAKLKKGIVTKGTIWDTLVFKKIQAALGGRVKYCITGAAPVSMEVLNFMRVALGIVLTEGYGQTEGACGMAVSVPGDFYSGSVGTPALCNLIKLVDVPEKNYFAKDGVGEICIKGPNICQGYYKDEAKTKETIDEDGWLHSGDVGKWLPNGSLKIIDRKKHIFKLAQGEYIAPEKIEQVLVQSPAVAQVFLYGESLKASVVAVVVPDELTLTGWCSAKGESGSFEELCKRDSVKELIYQDMVAFGKLRGLQSFEIPKRIHITTEAFSIENNLLTPTFKSKRPQVEARYKEDIAKLYEGLQ